MIMQHFVNEEDRVKLREFDDENLILYVDDPFTYETRLIKGEDDLPLGLGIARVVNEFKIVLNPALSNFVKAKVLKELFAEAVDWADKKGSNETIVFITKGGEHYSRLLQKHFGFERVEALPLRR